MALETFNREARGVEGTNQIHSSLSNPGLDNRDDE